MFNEPITDSQKKHYVTKILEMLSKENLTASEANTVLKGTQEMLEETVWEKTFTNPFLVPRHWNLQEGDSTS